MVSPIVLHGQSEQNPLTMSDTQILEQIYTTHVHSDTKFDVDSLFTLVHNILKRSTHIVDNLLQGIPGSPDHIDDKFPQASFFSPLCTLKQISYEMSCKPPGEDITHKTTLAILNKLSSYSWDAKAVLTLAAFALEHGEFWLISQLQPTDPLAKSVAMLKRVPALTKPAAVREHGQAIVELNNLAKDALQVIEAILELEKLNSYDAKDVPALAPYMEQVPVDVYWSITTVVACATQIDCLTTQSEQRQELSQYGQKIKMTLSKLRKQVSLCLQQKEEAEYYKMLKKMFQTPTEIMEVFKMLIYWKDAPQPLFDGATKTRINIEELKKKNLFLFISTLDITEEEISILRTVYEKIKTGNEYKLVWIPIVEEWNDQLREKFEILKSKMPWYVLQYFAPVAGYKFIKEDWHFKKQPMVVAMNPQTKVLHPNAFHMIQVWGLEGFPFTLEIEKTLTQKGSWIVSLVADIHPNINIWIKEGKYIFFYGGKDKDWIQQFTTYAGALANDAFIKEAKIPVELFCLENEDRNITSRFWSGVESLFVTMMHEATNTVAQEVQKMLSYKNETGWALLSKGPTGVLSGHGITILKTVAEFGIWKELVTTKAFEIAFKQHHEKVVRNIHICSHLEIPNVAGKIPEIIMCPDCHRTMDVYMSYKCCHNETTANSVN